MKPNSGSMIDEIMAMPLDARARVEMAYLRGLEHGIQAGRLQLSHEDAAKLRKWQKELDARFAAKQGNTDDRPYYGAIGGAYTYSWTATSLGVVVKVKNEATGDVLDLTNYDW